MRGRLTPERPSTYNAPMRLPLAIERLLTEVKARYEVEPAGMAAGVRARLESRLALRPLALDADLEQARGRLHLSHARTLAFAAPRLRKVVWTEVGLFPVVPIIDGFALTLLPEHGVRAPIFAGDFMLLPSAVSVGAEVYGPRELTAEVFVPTSDTFAKLGARPVPAWADTIASGRGLRARVSPRIVGEAYGAFTSALGAYLDALAVAPDGDPAEGAQEQAEVFRALHEHGPRRRMRWLFGEAWAERYSRLAFE